MINNYKLTICALTGAAIVGGANMVPVSAAEQNTQGKFVIENGVLISAENFSGEVAIPDTVTEIKYDAFDKCADKITSIKIPGSIKKLEMITMEDMINLEKVEIAYGVKEIGGMVFAGCKSLKEVILPDSIEKIGQGVFSRNEQLKEITLPKNIKRLEDDTFSLCTNLEIINTDSPIESFGMDAVSGTKWLEKLRDNKGFAIYNGILIDAPKELGDGDKVVVPDGVKVIGQFAFKFKNIKEATIPDSVVKIDSRAFLWCRELVSVKMGKSVKEIGGKRIYML